MVLASRGGSRWARRSGCGQRRCGGRGRCWVIRGGEADSGTSDDRDGRDATNHHGSGEAAARAIGKPDLIGFLFIHAYKLGAQVKENLRVSDEMSLTS